MVFVITFLQAMNKLAFGNVRLHAIEPDRSNELINHLGYTYLEKLEVRVK